MNVFAHLDFILLRLAVFKNTKLKERNAHIGGYSFVGTVVERNLYLNASFVNVGICLYRLYFGRGVEDQGYRISNSGLVIGGFAVIKNVGDGVATSFELPMGWLSLVMETEASLSARYIINTVNRLRTISACGIVFFEFC